MLLQDVLQMHEAAATSLFRSSCKTLPWEPPRKQLTEGVSSREELLAAHPGQAALRLQPSRS